jgi:hypothetical protein
MRFLGLKGKATLRSYAAAIALPPVFHNQILACVAAIYCRGWNDPG